MLIEEMAKTTRYYKEDPKGVSTVCKAMEDMRNEALEIGKEIGKERGREENLIENINSLMLSLNLTAQQAMDALQVPPDKQSGYLAKL